MTQGKNETHQHFLERQRKNSKNHYKRNALFYINKSKQEKIKLKLFYQKLKLNYHCSKCSESDPCCIDFHHKNINEKEFNIGCAVRLGISHKKLLTEIKKCTPLCRNCHAKLHFHILKNTGHHTKV